MGKNNLENAGCAPMPGALKGIAASISVVLLLVALLFLTVSIAHYSNMVGKSSAMLAQISGAQEQFDAASFGVRSLFGGYGAKASLMGNTATFTQDLAQGNISLQKEIIEWGRFLGSQYGSGNTAINAAAPQEIRIYPQNLSIWSSNGTGCHGFDKCIFIDPGNGTVNAYNLKVEVSVPGPLSWTYCNFGKLRLNVVNTNAEKYPALDTFCPGGAGQASVDIAAPVGDELAPLASARFNNPETLEFDYEAYSWLSTYYLTVVAELDTEPSYIELWPEISSASGTVVKQGRVRLE